MSDFIYLLAVGVIVGFLVADFFYHPQHWGRNE